MFCTRCGVSMADNARFCAQCGHVTAGGAALQTTGATASKLTRPREDRKIAGVCAGFARYFGVDVTLTRLVAVILIFWPMPIGLVGYIVAWIIIPNDPILAPASTQTTVVRTT
ncbi:MAG TPA: PspC domain-containing protein [Bryobacteraceae bacterium]|nr:PspC domain-containing protein [Bryobacteraceae bacterium]